MKSKFFLIASIVLTIMLCVVFIMTGCKTTTETTTAAETTAAATTAAETSGNGAAEPEFVIGNLLLGQTHPVHILRAQSGIAAAEALGGKMIIKTSEGTLEKAIAAIDAFIEEGVDAIIVDSPDPIGIIPAAQKAVDAGIIYIAGYSTIDVDSPLAYDAPPMNVMFEVQRAKLMAAYHNYEGKFAFLAGLVGQKFAEDLVKGFYKGMYEMMATNPKLEIADVQYTSYDAVEAQKIVQNWITQYPDLTGISTCSDSILYAGADDLTAAGMDSVTLWGHDGDKAALEFVRDGAWECDFAGPGVEYNEWLLTRMAVDIIRGIKVPQAINVQSACKLVVTDKIKEIAVNNGFPGDIETVTPEKALEGIGLGGAPYFGPDIEVDWQKIGVTEEQLAAEDEPLVEP